jgi:hypothetical protein
MIRRLGTLALVLLALMFTMNCQGGRTKQCGRDYGNRLQQLQGVDAQQEAKKAFCSDNKHFKVLIGIETLMLGVPEKWRDKGISKKEIVYFDAIQCNEHRHFLEAQDKYVRGFNVQMVGCLELPASCCLELN